MTDQLYCPECADKWNGAYNSDHRCVTCGSPLKAEKVMDRLKALEEERDALAARYAALADEVRAMIQDSDGLAGYHLNGEVACWSELEVGHLLSEPGDLGEKVLARRDALKKARWQAEALEGIEAVGKLGRVKPEQLASFAGSAAEELRRQAEGEP